MTTIPTENNEQELVPQKTTDMPTDTESQKIFAANIVKADITASKQSNESESGRRSELYDLYRARGSGDKGTREHRSRISSSDVMDSIEWMMPSLMKAFCGVSKAISVLPQGKEDIKKAEKMEKLLNWQFMNKCRGFLTMYEWIKAALIYGSAFAKCTWENEYVTKGFAEPVLLEPQMKELYDDPSVDKIDVYGGITVENIPQTQNMNAMPFTIAPQALEPMRVYRDVRGERRIKIYSGPKVDIVPPEDFLYDTEAKSIEQMRFAIHRVRRTIAYLREKELEGIYSNIDEVVRVAKTQEYQESDEAESRDASAQSVGAEFAVSTDNQVSRVKVFVYEWWGMLDMYGDGRAEPYLVVVCCDKVIRMEKNPYAHGRPPFVALRPILDVFQFLGIGYAEMIGEFQKFKTSVMQQVSDNLSFQNNQMWEVLDGYGVDTKALASPWPGKIVRASRQGGIRQITPQSFQGHALQLLEFVQSQAEQRSGVTRYNQGLDANSLNKTATGIKAIMGASASRIELVARIFAETGVRPLYMMMLSLNQQFIDQDVVVRVFNEPLEISTDDIAGEFDVTVDIGGATAQEDVEVQQLMTVLGYAGTLMQIGVMSPQNVYESVKRIFELWGFKDSSKFINDPQEAMLLRQAMGALEQLGQMAAVGQLPPIENIASMLQQIYMILGQVSSMRADEGTEGQPVMGGGGNGGQNDERQSITGFIGERGRVGAQAGGVSGVPVPAAHAAGYGGT
ncbi:MAG: hypothetical protein RR214_01140 [Synergistaceae bacterium]